MKEFRHQAIRFLLLQAVVLFAVLLFGAANIDRKNDFLASAVQKAQRLESLESPKLIIIGDSSAIFGFHSQVLEEETGLETINYALHASIPLEILLSDTRSELEEGDVVLVSFAYSKMVNPGRSLRDLVVLYRFRPELLLKTDFSLWKRFGDEGTQVLGSYIRNAFQRVITNDFSPPQPPNDVYTAANFNQFGDMVGHYGRDDIIEPLSIDRFLVPHPEQVGTFVEELNKYHARASSKGARVLFTYGPIPDSFLTAHRSAFEDLDRKLRDSLELEFLGSLADHAFPESDFADSEFHLQEQAGGIRSQRVGNLLRQELQLAPDSN